MHGRFIGIDFCGTDIRVCVINRNFSGESFEQKKLVPNCAKISEDKDLKVSTSYASTSLVCPPISSRVLEFPFSDSKKIRQVYKFELASATTYNPDDKLHAYHLVKRDGRGEVLSLMFEFEDMRSFLAELRKDGIDPMVVTFSPFSFGTLNDLLPQDRPLMLVDISCNEMSAVLFDEHGLRRIRSSSRVLSSFLDSLSQGSSDSVDFREIDISDQHLKPLINDIMSTSRFFEAEIKQEIRTVVLTGDICDVDSIEEVFGQWLDKEVRKISIPDLGDDSPKYAKSYALTLYGIRSNQDALNLRVNEFEYMGGTRELKRLLLVPGLLICVLLLLVFYRGIYNYQSARSVFISLQREIQEEMREVFPSASALPNPVSFLEGEVKKFSEKLELIGDARGGTTPLDVLKDLTVTFPKEEQMKVDEIRFGSEKEIKLWGRCNSYKDLATLEKILTESKRFTSVKRDQVSQSVNDKVKFIISMKVN